jgi:UPF0716 protein FxsA
VRPVALVGLAAIIAVAIEVAVFVAVVKLVGLPWALAALIVLSVVGGWLVPRQGIRAWRRFRAAAAAGNPPGRQVTDGLVGLIGALLLAVPGFVSALAGMALLVPPLRWYARDRLERSVERRTSSAVAGNLFGPRQVRVRRGRASRSAGRGAGPTGQPPVAEPAEPTGPTGPTEPIEPTRPSTAEPTRPGPAQAPPAIEGEVIEGEIIDKP